MLLVTDVRAVDKLTLPIVQAGAAKLGITFTVRKVNGAYPVIQTTSRNVPISNRRVGSRTSQTRRRSSTRSSTDATSSRAVTGTTRSWGSSRVRRSTRRQGDHEGHPQHRQTTACSKLPLGGARTDCFAGIDRVLTKDIVPWIPYMWANTVTIISPDVTQWKFDQNAGFTALAHVAVKS